MPIDYKKYPPNWKDLRKQVLQRANNCCEFCGLPNYAVGYREDCIFFPICGNIEVDKAGRGELPYKEARLVCKVNNQNQPSNEKYIIIVLTIAHIDHDPENHSVSIDRLRALCQKCHLALDKDKHLQTRQKSKNKKQNSLTF